LNTWYAIKLTSFNYNSAFVHNHVSSHETLTNTNAINPGHQ